MAEKIDKAMIARMNSIGESIESRLPEGHGFFVLVFPFVKGENVRANYCSNGDREGVLNAMKEFLIECGHGEDWMKHI